METLFPSRRSNILVVQKAITHWILEGQRSETLNRTKQSHHLCFLCPQRWVKTLTQQGALLELQAWMEATESQLGEHGSAISQTSSTSSGLSQLLKYCKVEKNSDLTSA